MKIKADKDTLKDEVKKIRGKKNDPIRRIF